MRRWWIGLGVACASLLPSPVRAQEGPNLGAQEELRLQREANLRLQVELANRAIERQRLGEVVFLLAYLAQQAAAQQAAADAQQAAQIQAANNLVVAQELIREADDRLIHGESFIGDYLDAAEPLLPPGVSRYIVGARAALRNSDLSGAHFALQTILLETGGQ
jgi:hypothetical protein